MANIHSTTLELSLSELVDRQIPPRPWDEGDKIPWDDPAFSRRMLGEHLTDRHDRASPPSSAIDRHVAWIHGDLLARGPTKILDLGCGPGLYTNRLAGLGHECVGVDFGPASIEYARLQAEETGACCRYIEDDLRVADWGADYGLAMMLHGEFNTFRPGDSRKLMERVHGSLCPGGVLLLVVTEANRSDLEKMPNRTWFTVESGLFSDDPYVGLMEQFWDPTSRAVIARWYIIDAGGASVRRYSVTTREWERSESEALLRDAGFADVRFQRPVAWNAESYSSVVVIGRKAPAS